VNGSLSENSAVSGFSGNFHTSALSLNSPYLLTTDSRNNTIFVKEE